MRDRVLGMDGDEMKLIIDEVPLSKNEYINLHWSVRMIYKDMISWLIYEQHKKLMNNNVEDDIGDFAENVTITFHIYFKTKRRRDVQNYLGGGLIAWLDALVDQQVINDDCYDCIGQPLVTFNIDKANPRTEIVIKIIV